MRKVNYFRTVLTSLPHKNKVYTFVLREESAGEKQLVFFHEDFPVAGIQIPGGSVEPGDKIRFAAMREVTEETGLMDLKLVQELGAV